MHICLQSYFLFDFFLFLLVLLYKRKCVYMHVPYTGDLHTICNCIFTHTYMHVRTYNMHNIYIKKKYNIFVNSCLGKFFSRAFSFFCNLLF